MLTTGIDRALDLANLGYRVFPVNGKLPAIAGGHGCLDATTDADKLRRRVVMRVYDVRDLCRNRAESTELTAAIQAQTNGPWEETE